MSVALKPNPGRFGLGRNPPSLSDLKACLRRFRQRTYVLAVSARWKRKRTRADRTDCRLARGEPGEGLLIPGEKTGLDGQAEHAGSSWGRV